MRLPVSHAFHTAIVAPASEPLRAVLRRLRRARRRTADRRQRRRRVLPDRTDGADEAVSTSSAGRSPRRSSSSRACNTLYDAGARVFVEVGPKKALHGFAEDVSAAHTTTPSRCSPTTPSSATSSRSTRRCAACTRPGSARPRTPRRPAERCRARRGVHAAPAAAVRTAAHRVSRSSDGTGSSSPHRAATPPAPPRGPSASASAARSARPAASDERYRELGQIFADRSTAGWPPMPAPHLAVTSASRPPTSRWSSPVPPSVCPASSTSSTTPTSAGSWTASSSSTLIPQRFRQPHGRQAHHPVVKGEDGSGSFVTIDDTTDVIKLAGRTGALRPRRASSASTADATPRSTVSPGSPSAPVSTPCATPASRW